MRKNKNKNKGKYTTVEKDPRGYLDDLLDYLCGDDDALKGALLGKRVYEEQQQVEE